MKKAFTIIELIVAVSVILLVLAIAITGFRSAIDRSVEVSCAANLRSLGSAIYLYANENNYQLPGPAHIYVRHTVIPLPSGQMQSLTGHLVAYLDNNRVSELNDMRFFPSAFCGGSARLFGEDHDAFYRTSANSPFGRSFADGSVSETLSILNAEARTGLPLSKIYAVWCNDHPNGSAHRNGRNYLMLDGTVQWLEGDQFGPP